MKFEPYSDVICFYLEISKRLYDRGQSCTKDIEVGKGWMLDITRMIEYNIHDASIQRPVQRASSSVERIRPDDALKWIDDGIFAPVKSKSMKGLE